MADIPEAPMITPMSDSVPLRFFMYRGNRKKVVKFIDKKKLMKVTMMKSFVNMPLNFHMADNPYSSRKGVLTPGYIIRLSSSLPWCVLSA